MKSIYMLLRSIFTFSVFISAGFFATAQVQWPIAPVNSIHRIWEGFGQYAGNTGGTGWHFHEGLDLPVDSGTAVFAVTAGRILERNTNAGVPYAQFFTISESLADTTLAWGYVHINFNEFKNDQTRFWRFGDTTAVGDTIGFVSKHPIIMPHLHFEKDNDDNGFDSAAVTSADLDGNPIDHLTPNTENEKPTILTPVRYRMHNGTFFSGSTACGDTIIRNNVDIFANMYDRFSNFAGVTNYNISIKKVEFGVKAYQPANASAITFPQNQIDFSGLFLSNDTSDLNRNTIDKFRNVKKTHTVYSNDATCTSVFQPTDGSINDAVYWHYLTHIDTTNFTFQETDQDYFWDTNGKEGEHWNDPREAVAHEADSNKTAAFPDGRYIVNIKCYGYGGAADTVSLNDTIFVNNFNEFIYSCNSAGKDQDYFCIGDPVYIKGKGFPKSRSFKLHFTKDTTWTTGMAFDLPVRIATITVSSDADGHIAPTLLMASYTPNDSPDKGYDIVIDYEGDSLYTSVTDTCTIDPLDNSISGTIAINGINPFQKTYGGPMDEVAQSVYPTLDGGYIFAGSSFSFGSTPNDVYLVKTDINGDTAWTRTFSGIAGDNSFSVQQTSDSGYIVTGHNTTVRDDDIYLIRANKNGDLIWIKNFGTTLKDKSYGVQQTDDGGYIITGHAYLPGGEVHAYLIKMDGAGTVVWTKIYNSGPGRSDLANAVYQTTDGGYIVAGYTIGGTGGIDAFLIRTDASGGVVWIKLYGGLGIDYAVSVQQTSDGGFIFAGSTTSFGPGDFDVYIVRTNPLGVELWTKKCGGSDADFGYSIRQTTDGGFIVAGKTSSFDVDSTDVYVIKLDATGVLVWSRAYGGPADDLGNSVSQAKDGGYIIAGGTFSFGAGGSDAYLIKTDCIGSSGCNEAACATTSTWCVSSLPPPPPPWTVTTSGTPVSPSPVIGMGGSTVTTICDCIKPEQPGSITMTGGFEKVCPGDIRTYTVPPVIRATSYTWTTPAGATISSGAGTNSVTITYSSGFIASGTLDVIAINSCGPSPVRTLNIERNTPDNPGAISGPAIACALTTQTYSTTLATGVTYSWIAPTKAIIISGQGTNTVTVAFSSNFKSGTLSVSAGNTCGTSSASTLSIISVALKPDPISGPSAGVCAGTTKSYSVPLVSGVTYTWTPPNNGSIASGQGTNTVTVIYNISFSSGTISVVATNFCGSSGARTQTIKSIPSTPVSISGPVSEVCAGTTKTYSVPFVSGVTNTWNPPASASIASGQGTNTVTVDFSPTFLSGSISVTATNACGISGAKTQSIKSVPTAPTAITGPSEAVCKNTTQTYSTPFVTGVTYTWTPPPNAVIASGQGTNTVTVDFNSSFSAGNIKVVAVNACGTSVLKSFAIKSKPTTPTAILGNTSPCIGAIETYSIAPVPGAVSYLWTKPSGSPITAGQGTTTVNISIGSTSGNITVKGVNVCGNGTAKSIAISATGCARIEKNNINIVADLIVYPNPVTGEITIEYAAENAENFNLQFLDLSGRVLLFKEAKLTAGVNLMKFDLSAFAKGVYILKFTSSSKIAEQRVVVQ